jgi:hypothetical protein
MDTVNVSSAWEDRLSELADYRKIHVHCNVPTSYSENNQLGIWVSNQRRDYNKHRQEKTSPTMTTYRIQALESLGFEWKPSTGRRKVEPKKPSIDDHAYFGIGTLLVKERNPSFVGVQGPGASSRGCLDLLILEIITRGWNRVEDVKIENRQYVRVDIADRHVDGIEYERIDFLPQVGAHTRYRTTQSTRQKTDLEVHWGRRP